MSTGGFITAVSGRTQQGWRMRIRPGSVRDVAIFAKLINDHNRWLRHEIMWEEDELAATLISASGEPVDNDRYVEIGGEAVAAIHVHMSDPYTKGTFTLAVPPHEKRAEITRLLLESGERIVRSQPQMALSAPLELVVQREDTELVAVAERLGFRGYRKVTTLEADVFDAPAPVVPADVTLSTFSVTRDLSAGYEVIREIFPPTLGSWYMSKSDYEYAMQNDPTALPGLSVIARDERGPIALALNFLDTTKAQTGFIAATGVVKRRRNEGIGSAMVLETFDRFRSRGWHHARIPTVHGMPLDDNNYRFYTSLGMQPVFDDLVMVKD